MGLGCLPAKRLCFLSCRWVAQGIQMMDQGLRAWIVETVEEKGGRWDGGKSLGAPCCVLGRVGVEA